MTRTLYRFCIMNWQGERTQVRILGGTGCEYAFLYDNRLDCHVLLARPRAQGEARFLVPEDEYNTLALDIFSSPQIGNNGNPRAPYIVVPQIEVVQVADEKPAPAETKVHVNVNVSSAVGAPESKLSQPELRKMAKEYLGLPYKEIMKLSKQELQDRLADFAAEQAEKTAAAVGRN